jgi:tetratricopeptide (TPR) repeat protein
MEMVKQYCESIQSFLEAGEYEKALGHAEDGLYLYPDDGRLWEMHGIALGCRRKIHEAMESLETASMLVPLSVFGQMTLAACYFRTHNLDTAKCIYEYLATREDLPAEILAELAKGLDQVGRTELAVEVCQTMVHRESECDSAWFAMACYMTKLDYPAETIVANARHAFDLRPSQVLYRVDLALLLAQHGRHEEAYHLLTEVDVTELLGIPCPPRLIGLIAVFQKMDDENRVSACKSWLVQIMQSQGERDRHG